MRKPRFLLDVDGILADFVGPFLNVLTELTGDTYDRQAVDSWEITAALKIPEDIAKTAYDLARSREGFCASIPVFDGAKEAVAMLKEATDLFIVTSPLGGKFWSGERAAWLWDHFAIPTSRVMSGSAKFICAGDYILDDKVSTLIEWRVHHPRGVALCWDTPHNRNDVWDGLRIKDWDTVHGIVGGWWA